MAILDRNTVPLLLVIVGVIIIDAVANRAGNRADRRGAGCSMVAHGFILLFVIVAIAFVCMASAQVTGVYDSVGAYRAILATREARPGVSLEEMK